MKEADRGVSTSRRKEQVQGRGQELSKRACWQERGLEGGRCSQRQHGGEEEGGRCPRLIRSVASGVRSQQAAGVGPVGRQTAFILEGEDNRPLPQQVIGGNAAHSGMCLVSSKRAVHGAEALGVSVVPGT